MSLSRPPSKRKLSKALPIVRPKPVKPPKLGRPPGLPDATKLLPPAPRTRRPHLVDQRYDWGSLADLVHENSKHGPLPRVVTKPPPSETSGQDLRRRIAALGLHATSFGRRNGISHHTVYTDYFNLPAGAVPTKIERLVEFEETLAQIADLIDEDELSAETLRMCLAAMLDQQIRRM